MKPAIYPLPTASLVLSLATPIAAAEVNYLYSFDAVVTAESVGGDPGGGPPPPGATLPAVGTVFTGFVDVTFDNDAIGDDFTFEEILTINDCSVFDLYCGAPDSSELDDIRAFEPSTGLVTFSTGSPFAGGDIGTFSLGYYFIGGSGYTSYETTFFDGVERFAVTYELEFDFTSVTAERISPAPVIPLPAGWIGLVSALGLMGALRRRRSKSS